MAPPRGEGESDGTPNQTVAEGRCLRIDELLPLVRAAMAHGEGPPALLAWVRSQEFAADPDSGTEAHEGRAQALAERLSEILNAPRLFRSDD
jgi:hypothetical protein